MPVPLDKMKERSPNGEKTQASLHPSRIEKMVFVSYVRPPGSSTSTDRADYDIWMERVAYLCDDLHWLLQQPHDKFWCQAIFDDTLHKALDSFLRYSPRAGDVLANLPEAAVQRQTELCRLVFMVYLRLSTHKESKDHFITPEVFGEILYENFLFDIPKILDLSALYGRTNGALLGKMLTNIFTQQPKYLDDLQETVPTILQVFTNIAAKCGMQLESAQPHSPQLLAESRAACSPATMSCGDLSDVVMYLWDTADTLHRFLDVYPAACPVFQQFNFCSVVANFFDSMTPELTSAIKQLQVTPTSVKKKMLLKLHQIKKSLLTSVHLILNSVCLQPIIENSSDDALVTERIEEFLHTMTSLLGERRFLAAYEGMFSFKDDVDLLVQTSAHIDSSQFEYIQSAINSAFSTFGHRRSPRGDTNTGGRTSPDGAADNNNMVASGGAKGTAGPVTDVGGAGFGGSLLSDVDDCVEGAVSCPRPNDVELESLISNVKDLFPHLGEGFIESALESLGWDPESVVSSVLEDNLPASLSNVRQDLPRQKRPDTSIRQVHQGDGQTEDGGNLLDSRKNVFDNDEFDVFRNQNVDKQKIHIGKKEKKADLEDKSVIQAVKATYDAYGSVDQESIYDKREMYEDEYDDTYDSHAVGAGDADEADELSNKKFLPRVLQDLERQKNKGSGRNVESDDSEDEDDSSQSNKDDFVPFVADPAKLREAAEMRRRSQGRGRGRGGGATGPPRNRDVVGASKGQGQSKEVKQNRRAKEQFKGQRNRNQAEKKMSKGMF